MPSNTSQLRSLAIERFGRLNKAEVALILAAAEGEWLDCDDLVSEEGDVVAWPPSQERIIRADFLRWVCIDPSAASLIDPRGIRLANARVIGDELDLSFSSIVYPINIVCCSLPKKITMEYTTARRFELRECSAGSIHADELTVESDLSMATIVTNGELQLRGASIAGHLTLTGSHLTNPGGCALRGDRLHVGSNVSLAGVVADGEMRLLGAVIAGQLNMVSAQLHDPGGHAFGGDEIQVRSSAILSQVRAKGEIRFVQATITGQLDLSGAQLHNPQGYAFVGDQLGVSSNCYCHSVVAEGEVRLRGASIGGELILTGSQLHNPSGCALRGDGLRVEADCLLEDLFANGEVLLKGASVAGQLVFTNSRLNGNDGCALNGDRLQVGSNASFARVVAAGELRLRGSVVKGQLNLADAQLLNLDGHAFGGDELRAQMSVSFARALAEGEVRLLGAIIAGQLIMTRARLRAPTIQLPEACAFIGDRLQLGSNLYFNEIDAVGGVRISGATVSGQLICSNARLRNLGGYGLMGSHLQVASHFFLDGIDVEGAVWLPSATVTGHLLFKDAHIQGLVTLEAAKMGSELTFEAVCWSGNGPNGLIASRGSVTGTFKWRPTKSDENIYVIFSHLSVYRYDDDEYAWPASTKLMIDSFHYQVIAGIPGNAESRATWLKQRIRWIRLHGNYVTGNVLETDASIVDGNYQPQPYEHLSSLLRRLGYEREARIVTIAKQDALRTTGSLAWHTRFKMQAFNISLHYGYALWRPIVSGAFVVVGLAFLYWWGFYEDLFISTATVPSAGPNQPIEIPWFNPLLFSLDVFLPIIDFGQQANWQPKGGHWYGSALLIAYWVEILLGWVASTLFVLGISSIVRRH